VAIREVHVPELSGSAGVEVDAAAKDISAVD
jgi:hypothetical protein